MTIKFKLKGGGMTMRDIFISIFSILFHATPCYNYLFYNYLPDIYIPIHNYFYYVESEYEVITIPTGC